MSHTVRNAAQNATKAAHPPITYNDECGVMLFRMSD